MSVNLVEKLAAIRTHWNPHLGAGDSGDDVLVVKFQGAFPFPAQPDRDETYLVVAGEIEIDIEVDARSVTTQVLRAGEHFVVPQGQRHPPRAPAEAQVLLIEPNGTARPGDPATAPRKHRR